jgi:hypothetical protein
LGPDDDDAVERADAHRRRGRPWGVRRPRRPGAPARRRG